MWKGSWKSLSLLPLPQPFYKSDSTWKPSPAPFQSLPKGSSSSAFSFHSSSSFPNNLWGFAVSTYKAVAFLALLSLIPSPQTSFPSSSILASASLIKEADLQKVFKLRNENEWKSLWHQEKHVRCRDQLLTHMDWACQKDIYRLEKRFRAPVPAAIGRIANGNVPLQEDDPVGFVFLGKSLANTVIKPWSGYLRRKREEKSITDECCSAAGCTWEEYAEYCPAHRRIQTRQYPMRK